LCDVSTSALVFVGFRASRRLASERYPYGYERAEDLAGIGVALVIWASAIIAGVESVDKPVQHGATHHVGWGIAAVAVCCTLLIGKGAMTLDAVKTRERNSR
jgi:divalent metal cation (Fe/Co/Zn/Cd) transporter